MARQAHIVSFEDARDRSRRYTSSLSLAGGNRVNATDDERADDTLEQQLSRADARRRQRAKQRADKMFDRQFSQSRTASVPEEGMPRPALYEGKMGSTHRKSARMQRSSSVGSPSVKINPAGWFSNMPVSTRGLKLATALLCCVLACTFLYVPAQQYYQAQREHDRLAAEYSIIESRNDTLDVQNDILASDAGLEDAVRQKYGYIKTGEQTAVVTGLSENATDTSRDSDNIEANVLSSSVKPPEEWYTPMLDAFFGVE